MIRASHHRQGLSKINDRPNYSDMSPSKVESKPQFPADADSESYAQQLDSQDPLRSFRDKFIIPSKANLKSKALAKPGKFSIGIKASGGAMLMGV